MANEFVTLTPYDEQLEKLRQRQRMADLLQQQAMQPLESQTAPGGYVVPTSPLLGLAKMLQAYSAGRAQRGIDTELSDIRNKAAYDQRQKEAEIESAGKAIQGRMFGERDTGPEKKPEMDYDHQLGGTPMPSTLKVSPTATMAPRTVEEAGQLANRKTLEANTLEEITPTSQYRYDPQGALQVAMTPAGSAAMQKNAVMASMLANMVKPKEPEEFGTTPVLNAEGEYMLPSKSGRLVRTGVKGATKEPTGSSLSKLIAERDALPANSPSRAIYDAAIRKETERSPGVTVNYGTTAQTGVDAQGNPVFFQTSPQGGAPSIVQGVRPRTEAMGAAESNAATFADRMTNANPIFDQLPPPSIGAQTVSGIPLVGNTLINARNRQFQQAEQDFISAVLRKESGAAISDAEYDRERKKYIPVANDDPQTLEMKRKSREAALAGMRRSAGPSYKPLSSMPAPTANDLFSQADAIVGRGR